MAIVTSIDDSWVETNKANVGFIITNMERILSEDLGYNLERDIKDDPDMDTEPALILHYQSEEFEENFGEKPLYNIITFLIQGRFKESDPESIRDRAKDIVHDIRGGVTVDNLNTGSLVNSKIVTWVNHEEASVTPDKPVSTVDYVLSVRYREINSFG